MPFFQRKRLFIILIGFIVLVALIGYSLKDREDLTTAEKIINDSVGWAQRMIHTPVNFVTDIFTNIDEFRNMYQENQILKEKLSQYKGLIYEVQEIKEENKELRETLDVTESIRDYTPIQATVISRSPERWAEKITLNKGSKDGVAKNMAVITAEGMVGKIQNTSGSTSVVQLLTGFDQYNRISATISRKKGDDIFGMIEGFDKESNSLLFKIIEESDQDLKEGEQIFSSGKGGVFPAGLQIGEVKEVISDQYGLTRTALVKPAANMYDINQVIIVDRTLEKDDDPKSEEEEE